MAKWTSKVNDEVLEKVLSDKAIAHINDKTIVIEDLTSKVIICSEKLINLDEKRELLEKSTAANLDELRAELDSKQAAIVDECKALNSELNSRIVELEKGAKKEVKLLIMLLVATVVSTILGLVVK